MFVKEAASNRLVFQFILKFEVLIGDLCLSLDILLHTITGYFSNIAPGVGQKQARPFAEAALAFHKLFLGNQFL